MVLQDVLNFTTIAGWAGAAAVVLLVLGFFKAYKTEKTKKNANIVVGLLGAVFLIGAFGGVAFLTDPINSGGGGTTLTVGDTPAGNQFQGKGVVCAVEDTTVTLASTNKFTTVSTGGTHRFRINSNPALTVADAGTFTASPGDTLEVFFGNGTDGTYFGSVDTFVIPCVGTKTFSAERTQNGTLTINVFNEEGNLITANSNINETLGAGDIANLKIEIRASNQQGFPHGGILTLELNGSDYDEENIELSFGDLIVTKLSSSPQVHTLTNVANKLVSWEIGAFEGANLHTGTLILDVDVDNNPDSANDPVLTWRPSDIFINEDTGGSFDGPAVEDEDNVATFAHVTTSTISVV